WYGIVDQAYVDAMKTEGLYKYTTAKGATEETWFIGNYFKERILTNLDADLEEGIREGWVAKADTIEELAKAFDLIIMQNDNFPEVKEGRVYNRVRELKFAQDAGQRIVALCDNVENLYSDREAKFLMPMIEDIVFGGIPTDRTTIFPSPEEACLWNGSISSITM
ncbi:MAG: hypothetical protein IJ949_05565, partial [Oscillospiraceae bacterium]|nr:hypothetical protein [Oscillospiraceae bacterium]